MKCKPTQVLSWIFANIIRPIKLESSWTATDLQQEEYSENKTNKNSVKVMLSLILISTLMLMLRPSKLGQLN